MKDFCFWLGLEDLGGASLPKLLLSAIPLPFRENLTKLFPKKDKVFYASWSFVLMTFMFDYAWPGCYPGAGVVQNRVEITQGLSEV